MVGTDDSVDQKLYFTKIVLKAITKFIILLDKAFFCNVTLFANFNDDGGFPNIKTFDLELVVNLNSRKSLAVAAPKKKFFSFSDARISSKRLSISFVYFLHCLPEES